MILRRLILERFMSHDSTTLDVPERGLIAVQGANGSGKSSLIECVSHTFWGKSLRGKTGWRNRKNGSKVTCVVDDGTSVSRRRESEQSHVEIVRGGKKSDGDLYDTAKKAQALLDHDFGSFDVWRRTSVFSSSDAAHFSLATDGERKRLLEVILGLERFDEALDRCRVALKEAQAQVVERVSAVDRIDAQHTAEKQRRLDMQAVIAELVRPTAPELETEPVRPTIDTTITPAFEGNAEELFAKAEAIDKEIAGVEMDQADVELSRDAVNEKRAQQRERLRVVREELNALGTGDTCSRCKQPIDHLRKQLAATLATTETEVKAAIKIADEEVETIETERTALASKLAELRASRRTYDSQIAGARRQNQEHDASKQRAKEAKQLADKQHAAALASWKARVAKAKAEYDAQLAEYTAREKSLRAREREIAGKVLDLEDELEAATHERDRARLDVAELEACEEALGLKGIRAHVLGRALSGIENVANYWLTAIVGPGLKLTLKPYSEKKTGGINDSISLTVEGAGAGEYLGASGGERRRFDVAILLALAEVARAAAGAGAGTIFFDEVFDALDRDGQAAVSSALRTLAEERAVFVITHSEDLARDLRADIVVTVKEGKIRVAA